MQNLMLYIVILALCVIVASFTPSGSATDTARVATTPETDIDSLRRDLDSIETRCNNLERMLEDLP